MLTSQRKRLILDVLSREGQVVAKRLSAELDLSEDTIRRDLRELAAEGLLLRVHGGAMPASPTVVALKGRRDIATEAKVALGRAAAKMIERGATVILDGGTSNIEIVRHLQSGVHFTAITHSPTIAAELEFHADVEVILIGGKLFRHSMVAVGALAMEAISRMRADLFFLGVTGVHAEEGFTTGDVEEAAVKRALISRSAETIVLATDEKLQAVSPFLVAPVEQISRLVVPATAPESALEPLAGKGLSIVRAS
jgi:DeoR/GlpR family transcriptional regulator of sugar metabolism